MILGLLLWAAASAATLAPIEAETLSGTPVSLPGKMPAEHTLLIFGFKQAHTKEFDDWRPVLAELSASDEVDWVELPFVDVGRILKGIIKTAMNATMGDELTREHFAPVWGPAEPTKTALGIDSDELVVVVVCDRSGEVLARVDGAPTAEATETLRGALEP